LEGCLGLTDNRSGRLTGCRRPAFQATVSRPDERRKGYPEVDPPLTLEGAAIW
jgi:hypothetical protein